MPRGLSPLPQGNPTDEAEPARLVKGFTAYLPGRSLIFFQRQFFASYPRPIQQAGISPFPRTIPIATIQAPKNQAIAIRRVAFQAFQASGIGVSDVVEVPKGRVVGTLGFRFTVGNRGLADFQTNLPGRGTPVSYSTVAQVQGAGTRVGPISGQGSTYQGTGDVTPEVMGQQYARYAMPSDLIQASVVLFRPPDFDLRIFEVRISGFLAAEQEMAKIIDRLSR